MDANSILTGPPRPEVVAVDASSAARARVGLAPLGPRWDHVEVVGIGMTARTVHELHVVAEGLIRLLVEEHGFRSVFIEGDRQASATLDAFVTRGTGDPRATLVSSRSFLAIAEILDLVVWLRHGNEHHGTNPVRLVHWGEDDLTTSAALERSLADQVEQWCYQHDGRCVYLGGVYHTAVAPRRRSTYDDAVTASAGSLLRDWLGTGYLSIGLSFGSGSIPQAVPHPPPTSLEARFDTLPYPTSLIEMDKPATRVWLDGVDRTRLIAPGYDPTNDVGYGMFGDPSDMYEIVVHHKVGTAVRPLIP